jgi:hypothetical protein
VDKLDENSEGSLSDRFDDFEATPGDGVWEGISSGLRTDAQLGGLAGAFADFEETPSPAVWDEIAADLHPNRKRRAAYWWWSAAASVALVLSSYFLWPNVANEATPLAEDKSNPTLINTPDPHRDNNANNPFGPEQNNAPSDLELNGVPVVNNDDVDNNGATKNTDSENQPSVPTAPVRPEQQVRNGLALDHEPSQNSNNDQNTSGTNSPNALPENSTFANNFEVLASMPLLNANPIEVMLDNNTELVFYPSPPLADLDNDHSDWALAANMQPFVGTPEPPTYRTAAIPSNNANATSSFGVATSGDISEMVDKTDGYNYGNEAYSPPIMFGGVVSMSLNNRFSLETGISYSILRSRQDAYRDSKYRIERNISMQYLGLPLQLKTNLINRKLTLYVNTGFLLERSLNTRVREVRFLLDEEIDSEMQKVSRQGGQVAAIAGLGLDIQVSKHMSLYLQPGVTRYLFQSELNVWSQKKYWGSMQTGLRFSF